MSNKKNSGSASGTAAPALESLQAKLASINHIGKLAAHRAKCMEHLDTLKEFNVSDPAIEAEESANPLEKITLRFGHESYDIKNPSLLAELRDYLIGRFEVRIQELEHEIAQAQL